MSREKRHVKWDVRHGPKGTVVTRTEVQRTASIGKTTTNIRTQSVRVETN